MKIGILGSGEVAKSLAKGFIQKGYATMLGTRNLESLGEWRTTNPMGLCGTFAEAAAFGDVLVLAVKGSAAEDALSLANASDLAGKTIVDTTNPIADHPHVNGVLKFFTGADESLLERLQNRFAAANFVKAFNSVGSAFMVDPEFAGGPPTMFICGNHDNAKSEVSQIVAQFGWEPVDMGMMQSARSLEQLCVLWCLPGFLRGEWRHAFKLLRS